MSRFLFLLFALFASTALAQSQSQGQTALQTSGTLVVVPAFGEVRHPNDEARATFMVEEQDKDRTAAVNRVNQKMKQGTDIIKREDPRARLETRGYHTYPVYADEGASPPRPLQGRPAQRQIVGWRVSQYLEVTTPNIAALPRTFAAAQSILALSGLQFGLSEATMKTLEERRIAAAYANLVERMSAIATAMGRSMADVVLDTVDFEGSGGYVPQAEAAPRMLSAKAMDAGSVEEPSFEPGETTLSMRVVGRARFQ
jgi:uncharacterized protein YggE